MLRKLSFTVFQTVSLAASTFPSTFPSYEPVSFINNLLHGIGQNSSELVSDLTKTGNNTATSCETAQTPCSPDSVASNHWTTPPSCKQLNGTNAYCVYSSNSFAGGKGIAILTSPENIANLLTLPAWTNPTAPSDANPGTNAPYIAKALPGKGIGLVARKTVHRGDLILSQTPALMIDASVTSSLDEVDYLPLQRLAVDRLPAATKEQVLDLHPQFEGDIIHNILRTNMFYVLVSDTGYNVLFPEVSRLNHDCRPNVHWYFDTQTLTHNLHALRTIHPGEELRISYIHPTEKRETRLKRLKNSWGFECDCSHCTAPPSIAAASDSRIEQILEIRDMLLDEQGRTSGETLALTETLVSLNEQERIGGFSSLAWRHAAVASARMDRPWDARKYAHLAVEEDVMCEGSDHANVKGMQELLNDLDGRQ